MQVLGQFKVTAELDGKVGGVNLKVVITNVPQLNLLSRQAMVELGLTDLTWLLMWHMEEPRKACKQLCQEFPDLFKPDL